MAEGDPGNGSSKKVESKTINLALQGGGAHGAFSWGVLDRLLRDERIKLKGISGTSAGAMNAVVLADGYLEGGSACAREKLEKFWTGVSAEGGVGSEIYEIVDQMLSYWKTPSFDVYGFTEQVMDAATATSPFGINPLDINPLGELLGEVVDFKRLRETKELQLFIAATNVRTGEGRIFVNHELHPAAVIASAALPHLFEAVHVEGQPYWDGGYVANPPLWPFYEGPEATDILLVQVNPAHRKGVPETPWDVVQRENEIMFNSALIKELRSIFLFSSRLNKLSLATESFELSRLHRIDGTRALAEYSAATKRDTSLEFFQTLKADGQKAADIWLQESFEDVGRRSSFDLGTLFVHGPAIDLPTEQVSSRTP